MHPENSGQNSRPSHWRAFRTSMGCSKSVAKFNTIRCQNRRWWMKHGVPGAR